MSRLLFCLFCGVFLAASPAAALPSVTVTGLENRIPSVPPLPAVFGAGTSVVILKINGAQTKSSSLRADFFQVSGATALPLTRDVHLNDAVAISDPDPATLRVAIKFPPTNRRFEMLVRLSLHPDAPLPLIALGTIRFEVFPSGLTRQLTDLLRPNPDGSISVRLFGSGSNLRRFLTQQHVRFEDLGEGTPNLFDPSRLYFAELDSEQKFLQAQDRSAGARLVVFWPDPSLPEGAYANSSGSGVFVHVTSPLLDNIGTDPRAQLALIKFVHLLAGPSSLRN